MIWFNQQIINAEKNDEPIWRRKHANPLLCVMLHGWFIFHWLIDWLIIATDFGY